MLKTLSQHIIACQGRFALSDDSHGPHAVGLHYDQAAKYLHSLGVRELWHLQKSDTLNVAGRTTRVVIVEGNWWEDEFWVGRLPKGTVMHSKFFRSPSLLIRAITRCNTCWLACRSDLVTHSVSIQHLYLSSYCPIPSEVSRRPIEFGINIGSTKVLLRYSGNYLVLAVAAL